MAVKIPDYIVNQTLYEGVTAYERYTVVDSRYNNRPARILYTDNQMAAQSGLPFDDKSEMLFDYNQRFMELVSGLLPKNVLVIGGGAFTLPMAIHTQFPAVQVDVYELDGELIKISERYFGLKRDSKLTVSIGDGLELLKKSKVKYDLILIDVFNSTEIPKEFNRPELPDILSARLKTNGVVAMNVIAAYHGVRAEMLKTIEQSFKRTFNDVKVFPAGSAISLWMTQNFLVVGGLNISSATKALSYKPI
ncbi:MAG TPA: fused MFS/spermidine synthase [Candidatus Saccharimonadales bacterium]|nr:fused MFS/spermidine synthase [Candidatus Saccharimonadales bacterium]